MHSLTGAFLKPQASNMAQKFWYILLDLWKFFHILENGDLFLEKLSQKRHVKKIQKNWVFFFC